MSRSMILLKLNFGSGKINYVFLQLKRLVLEVFQKRILERTKINNTFINI